MSHGAEQFSWVLLHYCSPPGCPFPIKSLALSAHVSPRTIHFQVLDKSPVSGPGRGPPSCNKIFEESQHKKNLNELLGYCHISFYFIQLLVWRNKSGRASKGFVLDATRMNILPLFPLSMCLLAQGGRSRVAFLSEAFMVQIPAARKNCQGEVRPSLCLPEQSNQGVFILPTYKASQTLRFLETPGPSKAHSRGSDNTTYAPGCCCWVGQSCPTLWDPTDYSPPGSSIHGISQARILDWAAISYSTGSFQHRDQTPVSCTRRWILCRWATREVHALAIKMYFLKTLTLKTGRLLYYDLKSHYHSVIFIHSINWHY